MDERALTRLLGNAMPQLARTAGQPLPRGLYRYVWLVSGPQQIRLCLMTVLVFPLSLLPVELQRVIVNESIERRDVSLLITLGIVYLVVLLLHSGLKFMQQNYQARLGEGVVRRLRKRIVALATEPDEASPAALPDEEDAVEGARVSIVSAETERIGGFVGESIAVPLLGIGMVATMFGYMLVIAPIIAAVSAALLLPAIYVAPVIQARINGLTARRTAQLRALGDDLIDDLDGDETPADRRVRASRRADSIFALRARIYMLKFLAKGVTNFVGHLGPLAIITVGGWLVIHGHTEIGTIVAFISANQRLIDPVRDLLNFYRQWQAARVQYRLYRDTVIEQT